MAAKPTASSTPSAKKWSHLSKSAEVAGASHEELVQTLVASLESSFPLPSTTMPWSGPPDCSVTSTNPPCGGWCIAMACSKSH